MQLIFRLTLMTSAAKSNGKLVKQKLRNTVLILDALYNELSQRGLRWKEPWKESNFPMKVNSSRISYIKIHLCVDLL